MKGQLSGGRSGGAIVKSGHDLQQTANFSQIRKTFTSSLALDNNSANEKQIEETTRATGAIKGKNELLKRASKANLDKASATLQTYNILWGHVQGAANLEKQWQQTTQRNLEQLSSTLMDMKLTQEAHDGFAQYMHQADDFITY